MSSCTEYVAESGPTKSKPPADGYFTTRSYEASSAPTLDAALNSDGKDLNDVDCDTPDVRRSSEELPGK